MLNITASTAGDELTVCLEGKLDTTSSPSLEKTLSENLEGIDRLILDMSALEYVSSAGLRVLLSVQKTMSRRQGLIVRRPSQTVMEIFDVTGFSDILVFE
jgi:anti-sigma B factor antagonist